MCDDYGPTTSINTAIKAEQCFRCSWDGPDYNRRRNVNEERVIDKLWAMEVFVRVAECGSFSRAAESLDRANATVTACVRNLERELGVTLINRDTRRIRLTEEGENYLASARELLEEIARTEEDLRNRVSELSGRVHIETTIAIGHSLLAPRLPEFAKSHPGITAVVTVSNKPRNLVEHGIDVAIRVGHVEDADVVARPLCDMKYVTCCTPEVAAGLPEHPQDLNPNQCLGITSEERFIVNPWSLKRGAELVTVRPDGPLHFNTGHDLLYAVNSGLGVAHILDVLVQPSLADGSLVQVYGDWSTRTKTLYLVMLKSRVRSAKVKAFTNFITKVLDAQRRPRKEALVAIKTPGRR